MKFVFLLLLLTLVGCITVKEEAKPGVRVERTLKRARLAEKMCGKWGVDFKKFKDKSFACKNGATFFK